MNQTAIGDGLPRLAIRTQNPHFWPTSAVPVKPNRISSLAYPSLQLTKLLPQNSWASSSIRNAASPLLTLYKDTIRLTLEFCSQFWGAARPTTLTLLHSVQRRVIRLINTSALTNNPVLIDLGANLSPFHCLQVFSRRLSPRNPNCFIYPIRWTIKIIPWTLKRFPEPPNFQNSVFPSTYKLDSF